MTPEEKIRNVESQVTLMERGQLDHFLCPYCGGKSDRGAALCCMLLIQCVTAILDRRELEDTQRRVERIMEQEEKLVRLT